MLPSLNRRQVTEGGFVATLTAALLGSTALPAGALAPSEIELLSDEVQRLNAEIFRTCDVLDAAELRYTEPDPIPINLAFHEAKMADVYQSNGKRLLAVDTSDEGVRYLQEIIDEPYRGEGVEEDGTVRWFYSRFSYELHRRRVRKAKRDLNTILAWRAEDQRRRDVAGVTEAQANFDAAYEAFIAGLTRFFDLEPTTVRDLAIQASLLDLCPHGDHEKRSVQIATRLCSLSGLRALSGVPPVET